MMENSPFLIPQFSRVLRFSRQCGTGIKEKHVAQWGRTKSTEINPYTDTQFPFDEKICRQNQIVYQIVYKSTISRLGPNASANSPSLLSKEQPQNPSQKSTHEYWLTDWSTNPSIISETLRITPVDDHHKRKKQEHPKYFLSHW